MKHPGRARTWVALSTLGAALLLAMLVSIAFGAVRVPISEIVDAIGRALSGEAGPVSDAVIVGIRLPRVILAALVGACLASAGVLYQALFRNPLADPYILGISSGAGLGAIIVMVATSASTAARFGAVPAGAFIGAILTISLVVRLASWRGRIDTTSLLLAGVAVSYTLAALTSFLMVLSRESMAAVVFWMMGGLTSASWEYVAVIGPMFLIGMIVPAISTRSLNLMLLGDDRASHLGLDVERFKLLVLGAGSLLVAAAVSVSGLIGFIGLMTPHMVRMVLGPDHRLLVPASVLGGAILMVIADLIARTVMAPVEIPVGIITALFGGPFFLWLLVRKDTGR